MSLVIIYMSAMNFQAIFSITLILFSVIDIPGSLPIILDMKRKGVRIHPAGATFAAGGLMLLFLFFGAAVLKLFGIDIQSFALAGSLIIFFMGLEMILGIRFFREEQESEASGTFVPLAFPLIAGAGTLTTIISLKAEYGLFEILLGIAMNLLIVFMVLRLSDRIARRITPQNIALLRKVFGILLLAIAFQIFRTNLGL